MISGLKSATILFDKVSEIHLFLAAINTYLKEYFIPVTLSDVSHIRTECCDQPAGLVCLGVRLLTGRLKQQLLLHFE